MTAKNDLTTEFTNAKWDAEAILDRIAITPTMPRESSKRLRA